MGIALGGGLKNRAIGQELPTGKRGYSFNEIDRKICGEGRPDGLNKDDLPTPALILDLDVFEANIGKMADHARSTGTSLRPHAKTHKCVQIARKQIQAGALGVSVATVPEAQVMVDNGVRGVLLTSPLASPNKIERIVALAEKAPDLMVVVDHPRQVELFQQAATAARRTLNVLVDVDLGDRRTGVLPGEPALKLARSVAMCKHLCLKGLQAFSGGSTHKTGFEARREYSRQTMTQAIETRELLSKKGLPADILSGASTGTYNIDSDLDLVTEMQVGSYVFMDVDYPMIGGRDNSATFDDFGQSLTVLATVVSATYRDQVTLDAGKKAFATDRSFGPEAKDVTGVSYRFRGDEFGMLNLEDPSREIKLGDRLEFIIPHCDPTVNLYDRIYACRGERVEEVWSVMDRKS